jgi:hypothetical protein
MQTETTRASAAGRVPGREDGCGGGQGQRAPRHAAGRCCREPLPGTLTLRSAELDAYTPECWHTSRAAVVRVVASDLRLAEEQQEERGFAKGS